MVAPDVSQIIILVPFERMSDPRSTDARPEFAATNLFVIAGSFGNPGARQATRHGKRATQRYKPSWSVRGRGKQSSPMGLQHDNFITIA
jgi:hypothetical protein